MCVCVCVCVCVCLTERERERERERKRERVRQRLWQRGFVAAESGSTYVSSILPFLSSVCLFMLFVWRHIILSYVSWCICGFYGLPVFFFFSQQPFLLYFYQIFNNADWELPTSFRYTPLWIASMYVIFYPFLCFNWQFIRLSYLSFQLGRSSQKFPRCVF